eukprot:9714489-Karenia_brevis.AAC.1
MPDRKRALLPYPMHLHEDFPDRKCLRKALLPYPRSHALLPYPVHLHEGSPDRKCLRSALLPCPKNLHEDLPDRKFQGALLPYPVNLHEILPDRKCLTWPPSQAPLCPSLASWLRTRCPPLKKPTIDT